MNNNMPKEERLSEKQKSAKKELMLKLKKEIDEMERSIKYVGIANAKIRAKRHLKIGARLLKFLLPYIISGTLVTGFFYYFDETPFHRDYKKRYLNTKTTLESNGHVSYVETYDEFSSTKGSLDYYDKWVEEENGIYSRNVKTYSIDNLTKEKVLEFFDMFNLQDGKLSLEDILGEPISCQKETSNYLAEEEILGDAYLKFTMYDRNTNKYIIVKESVKENAEISLAYAFLLVMVEVLTYFLVELIELLYTGNTLFDDISNIKEKNKLINVEALTIID